MSRRRFLRRLVVIAALIGSVASGIVGYQTFSRIARTSTKVSIPAPAKEGTMSLEEAISRRKSIRDYTAEPITISQLSQILWAAQGVTHDGLRSAPSAGALYPLEIYAVVKEGGVTGLQSGVYHYKPAGHTLSLTKVGDHLQELQSASLDQEAVGSAATTIVITAVFERTTVRYGQRGVQYVFQESGHAAQNIYLQCAALNLGSVVIGAFDENRVRQVLGAASNERPVYVQPIGVPST
ncbi:MAG: SagB/ThcOx family dehydrogenase [Nitrososphaerota archaeon]|nr:SagB/ThcOx family dehydrogenase [Nitrososphaerota archaeon]